MGCRILLLLVGFLCGCKTRIDFQKVYQSDFDSIAFMHKGSEYYSITKEDEIREFLGKFKGFRRDSTGENFKSFWFISFSETGGKSHRIEVFKNKFRFSGNIYVTDFDLEGYCKSKHQALGD